MWEKIDRFMDSKWMLLLIVFFILLLMSGVFGYNIGDKLTQTQITNMTIRDLNSITKIYNEPYTTPIYTDINKLFVIKDRNHKDLNTWRIVQIRTGTEIKYKPDYSCKTDKIGGVKCKTLIQTIQPNNKNYSIIIKPYEYYYNKNELSLIDMNTYRQYIIPDFSKRINDTIKRMRTINTKYRDWNLTEPREIEIK